MAFVSPATAASLVPSRQCGFILVSVLWIAGILAAFAIAVSISVRSHALHLRNAMSETLAAGIADGVTRLTALAVVRAGSAMQADGGWRSCRWMDEADAWVSVQDQGGLVDLNTASPALLGALFEGVGLAPAQAAEMVGAVQDYRDGDRASGLGGIEPAVYPGRRFGPKNAPFAAVEELDQLPSMTRDLLARLRAVTTVSNRQAGIDFGTAPAVLLEDLGLSRSSAAGLPFASPRGARAYAVTVAIRLDDGTRFVRRALIERTDQPERPFAVSAWEQGAWPEAALAIAIAGPCLDTRGAFRPVPDGT